ncbi:MAG: peptidase [Hyphomicrobiales bacterium]|nr:peptidase [Hyphomicrobiales bacterium]
MADNPFFSAWAAPFGLPPFADIAPEHFGPAFARGLDEHRAEIDAIARESAPATFANVIEAFERSGRALRRVSRVFWNLASADTGEALQAIEREMAPRLAAHRSTIYLDAALFARVDAVAVSPEGLSEEQRRVLTLTHKDFVRAGARLAGESKARMSQIVERLATLSTQFGQNLLKDEADFVLELTEADLGGLSEALRASAARTARERGLSCAYAITLSRSHVEPFLETSTRRDLREIVFNAFVSRGARGGATDNHALIEEIVALRAERAHLLGYESYAHFKLDDTMARTPENVAGLLEQVWSRGRARAMLERDDLQKVADAQGANAPIAAHDWRYYAAKLRAERFQIDEDEVKSYFQLDAVRAAAFDVAGKLFGLTFAEVHGLALYHPDVRAFEARDAQGRHVALFLADDFARPSKRSGAWMTAFRSQERLDEDVRPIIVNVLNVAKPGAGEPALLSLVEAQTLFHEFGHALHGMLSDVTYSRIAGTSVASDFVELPSQLYEHWLLQPRVLRGFARHVKTGEPMPEALLQRILDMRTFNQGFATVEYCSSALVDMDFHALPHPAKVDAKAFTQQRLNAIDMPAEIAMRHATPHFSHVFSGEGYAAGYYSYLWSEVLDADAFDAFDDTGDIFNPAVAARLREFIYAAGGRREPADAYRAFRGRLPTPEALLKKRGLTELSEEA